MFKHICIKPNETTLPTDIGFIAENLLYYDTVSIIIGPETIPLLVRHLDIVQLSDFLQNGNLKLYVRENLIGLASQSINDGTQANDFVLISSDQMTTEQVLFDGILRETKRRGFSKRSASKLAEFVSPFKYDNAIIQTVRNELDETFYIKRTIVEIIKTYNPEIEISADNIDFQIIKTDKGFLFLSNLNYDEINRLIPNNSDGKIISPTNILANILEAREDVYIGGTLNAELATTVMSAALMKVKFKDLYEKRTLNQDNIYQFNDFVLDNGHAIREVLNSGERKFSEFLEILNRAQKYKSWLREIGDDKNLIKEYYKEVTKDSWVDKLPGKAFRWSFFTGAGMALDAIGTGGLGTIAGLGLSVGDAFILDKLIKGWKPNMFVETDLRKFIGK